MKNSFIKCLSALLIIGSLISCKAVNNPIENSRISINSDWKFKLLDNADLVDNGFQSINFDDTNWSKVSLPHTANIEPVVVNDQWQGICWYRKSFEVPNFNENKKVIIEFEAAMNHSVIWVNGEEVSVHNGGYLPVVIDVTKYLKKDGKNILAVRLNNTDNPITGPKPLKILDFNMYGGLYRNAWLTVKEKTYISHPVLANKVAGGGIFITYPKVSEEISVVNVKTHIVNDDKASKSVELIQTVFYNNELIEERKSAKIDLKAGSDIETNEQFSLLNAKLWSPKNPKLYHLETKLLIDGVVNDKEITRFGIREFSFQNNDLYINGEKTFLRGVNRHQEYPFIGYALSDNAQYRDAKKIKDGGFDYIRLSHYPQSPAFMDACDELGLVVIDAILGWQYYNDTDAFRNQCYRSAAELIKRDRNRPSVLAWEVSLNETKMPIPFMEELDRVVHAEYPGKYVYSCGWMDDVYDIYLQARQHRILHPHELKENQPYSVSEYGDWEYYSKNAGLNQDKMSKDLRDEFSSRQARSFGEERMLRQAYNVQESHNDNLNTKAYSDSYWVMYDYNRGYHDDIERSGLMDVFRLPKLAYHFYKSQKDSNDEVVLNIASYWDEKSPLDIKVFSNCDEVSLYLNEKLIGTQKPDTDKNSTNLKHPPFTFKMPKFTAGTLKAVGYIKSKEVANHEVKTPGKAVGLKLWIDESGKKPQSGVNDVLFLYIAAVDANGTIVPEFSDIIDLKIDGDAKVMNVEKVKAEAGIAAALIRIGKANNSIKVSAISTDLNGEFEFDVQQ